MVALAVLVEAAATEVAEATVAESTRSIQLDPAKSKRARWANAAVGPVSPYLSSPSPFFAVISAAPPVVHEFDGNLRAPCYAFFWSSGSWCSHEISARRELVALSHPQAFRNSRPARSPSWDCARARLDARTGSLSKGYVAEGNTPSSAGKSFRGSALGRSTAGIRKHISRLVIVIGVSLRR